MNGEAALLVVLVVGIVATILAVVGVAVFVLGLGGPFTLESRERVERQRYLADARANVSRAMNFLLKFLVRDQRSKNWPTSDQLRNHLLGDRYLIDNPFTGVKELILVFADNPTGPYLMGRTIIRLVKPGQAIIEVRDRDGVSVLFAESLQPETASLETQTVA